MASIDNVKLRDSNFMKFVEQVSSGRVRLENNDVIDVEHGGGALP